MPRTDNSTEIKAPLETVWERMNDVENWPNLFTEYASAEILERNGEYDQVPAHDLPRPGVRRSGLELGLGADGRPGHAHGQGAPDRDRPVRSHEHRVVLRADGDDGTKMRWVQEFSMKPTAPATDDEAEVYINKNTKEQMAHIKEKLEAES